MSVFFLSQSALRLEFAMRLFGCDALIYLFFFKFFTSFLYFSSFVRTMLFVFSIRLRHIFTILPFYWCGCVWMSGKQNFRISIEIRGINLKFMQVICNLNTQFCQIDFRKTIHGVVVIVVFFGGSGGSGGNGSEDLRTKDVVCTSIRAAADAYNIQENMSSFSLYRFVVGVCIRNKQHF